VRVETEYGSSRKRSQGVEATRARWRGAAACRARTCARGRGVDGRARRSPAARHARLGIGTPYIWQKKCRFLGREIGIEQRIVADQADSLASSTASSTTSIPRMCACPSRGGERRQDLDECRLARAVGPEDRQERPLRQFEGHVIERFARTKRPRESANVERRFFGDSSCLGALAATASSSATPRVCA